MKKISDIAKDDLKSILKPYLELLLNGLTKDNIIEKKETKGQEVTYSVKKEISVTIKDKNIFNVNNEAFKLFAEFKYIASDAFNILEPLDKLKNSPQLFSDIVQYYEKHNVINIPNIDNLRMIKILNQGETLLDDDEIKKDAFKLISDKRINYNSYIFSILHFFSYKMATTHFEKSDVEITVIPSKTDSVPSFGFIGKNKNPNLPDLVFEIKYRKKPASGIKDSLFKGFEDLTRYNRETNKENCFVLLLFNDDNPAGFEKLNYKFQQVAEELFPTFLDKIFFCPISTKNLKLITEEFNKIVINLPKIEFSNAKYLDKPKIIANGTEEFINAEFINSKMGTVSVWVKLKSINDYDNKKMNNEYIISYATSDYRSTRVNGEYLYENVFAISLSPDETDAIGRKVIRWRFWISNFNREYIELVSPQLINFSEQWYHVLVRWDHISQFLELLIDGKLVDKSSDFVQYWPNHASSNAFLGTWGNKAKIHYLNLPLYRLLTTNSVLNDRWVKSELLNRPN